MLSCRWVKRSTRHTKKDEGGITKAKTKVKAHRTKRKLLGFVSLSVCIYVSSFVRPVLSSCYSYSYPVASSWLQRRGIIRIKGR